MVLGLFIITAIPTVTGVCQAVSAQKNRDQREKDERRMQKFRIDVECADPDVVTNPVLRGGRIVLKNDRLFIGPPGVVDEIQGKHGYGYVAEAFYIEYPDSERIPTQMGLVSQVRDNPPLLNWIYIDQHTMELKYGNKSVSISHHVGSWDWTANDEKYITFECPEGGQEEDFVAVQRPSSPGMWQVYCDLEQDGLDGYVGTKCKRVKVRLKRVLSLGDET